MGADLDGKAAASLIWRGVDGRCVDWLLSVGNGGDWLWSDGRPRFGVSWENDGAQRVAM